MKRKELDKVVAVAAAHMGLVVTGTIPDSTTYPGVHTILL